MPHSVPALVTPEVIAWARAKAGLHPEDVARRLRVRVEQVRSWEDGSATPTISKVRELGRLVKRPLAFFFLPEVPRDFDAIRDFRRLPGDVQQEPSLELLLAIRLGHTRREIALDLLTDLAETPATHLIVATQHEDPELLASRVSSELAISRETRRTWQSFYDALNAYRRAVEQRGVLVFQFGDVDRREARGFSIGAFPLPVISVNRSEFPQARIFSLLHEYIHLTLRQAGLCDFIEETGRPPEEQRIEVFCNRVAGAALVPADELLHAEPLEGHVVRTELDETRIHQLSLQFRVSRETILRRLLIFDRITPQFYERKRREYEEEFRRQHARAREGFAPPSAVAVGEAGRLFTRLVLQSYQEKKITAADVSEYMNIRIKHLPMIETIVLRGPR